MNPNLTLKFPREDGDGDERETYSKSLTRKPERSSGGTAMRIIVPLQGVVQGRGGLVLGSLIPCALFYFFQLYIKRNRSSTPRDSPSSNGISSELAGTIPRNLSRSSLSSRGSVASASISSRAESILKSPDSPYYEGNRRYLQDRYDRVSNPGGIIQLGIAENQLSLDLIRDWLATGLEESLLESGGLSINGLATYQPFDGLMDLKIAMAGFMNQIMQGSVTFNPSQFILTAGATPAVEILSFCLADPGSAFLVPSPYYPGFDRDIKLRTGIELIPVPCRSTDNFCITSTALERAYNQARKRGVKVRAVLISNPSNPVGSILKEEVLYDLLDFATEKNIHVISDEIYAGSTYGSDKFVSIAHVLETQDYEKNRVHIVYGLSKDLSIPGFRVGAIYSFNENVLAAASKFARFSSISVPTQRLLVSMLTDTAFITKYIEVNKEKLREMHGLFVEGLKQLGIKCANSTGGFYCWADMSKFIRQYSEKGELELWDKLLNVGKINVTPGSSCHCIEPGWFRCCFTTMDKSDVPVVMERIRRVVEGDVSNQ